MKGFPHTVSSILVVVVAVNTTFVKRVLVDIVQRFKRDTVVTEKQLSIIFLSGRCFL